MKLNFRKVHCLLTQARGRHEPPVTNNVWKQDNIFSTHPPPFLFDVHTCVLCSRAEGFLERKFQGGIYGVVNRSCVCRAKFACIIKKCQTTQIVKEWGNPFLGVSHKSSRNNTVLRQIFVHCDRFSSTFAAFPRPSCCIDNITK